MLFISKSKFLAGLQCLKLLWHAHNAKHLLPKPDAAQRAIYDQGHEVGTLAKQLFPGGIEVGQGVTGGGGFHSRIGLALLCMIAFVAQSILIGWLPLRWGLHHLKNFES
jgi:hypothetical protein